MSFKICPIVVRQSYKVSLFLVFFEEPLYLFSYGCTSLHSKQVYECSFADASLLALVLICFLNDCQSESET
jgi:hypothetical protein